MSTSTEEATMSPRVHATDKQQISIWLKKSVVKKLDALAAEYGISRAALIALWTMSEKKKSE